ncbi:hypothetical protein [Lampropedia aestuarii]|uniref:hypothetical protein n=1 Tax=Lampropedia aestuarii TaxID=2562762 RepID=UPI0024683ACC|nr:hypothetical protein [Lampropedia aestuarii]MDH5857759.1 hypothetical protein [Lampropedia aestuarii]
MKDYQPTQVQFDKDVASGVLEVLRDDGLYRHLRFRMSTGGFRWFDIVTWPDHLVITGDCETFTFQRLEDMFVFFRQGGQQINPGYWQEKILDCRVRARSFDWDTFRAEAMGKFEEGTNGWGCDDKQEAREALEDELDSDPDKHNGIHVLRNFQHTDSRGVIFSFDLSECVPDGMDWDYHYIWCCRAIVWAIFQYDKLKMTIAHSALEAL